MRILFVRHGKPDYARDCLTEAGHRQAEACAKRLEREDIGGIYTSPCGRARQTAEHTARRLGLPVRTLDYMREISWGGEGIPFGGHPWTLGDSMIDGLDYDFRSNDWREHPYFKGNEATELYGEIATEFDAFLAGFGYRRAGNRYLCEGGDRETVALFSHGGSGACALAHMLALPFPYVASVLPYDFTSITILNLPVCDGKYVHPRVELFNDCAHLGGVYDPKLQQVPDGERV